jgi:N-acetyl-gamma-glutamylphosphate reductase
MPATTRADESTDVLIAALHTRLELEWVARICQRGSRLIDHAVALRVHLPHTYRERARQRERQRETESNRKGVREREKETLV